MEIERRTYDSRLDDSEGAYIHRYYLPQEHRQRIQPQDLSVLYGHLVEAVWGGNNIETVRAGVLVGPCTIRYRAEGLVKEISADLLEPAVDASLGYDRDLQERRKRRGPFSDDYEIEVMVSYQLCDDHPLSRDDDNFVHRESFRKTASAGKMEECFQNAREQWHGDWNDTRGATNLAICNSPLFKIPHCLLFHNLQSHSQVPLKHICGIGKIWVEIQVWHQGCIKATN